MPKPITVKISGLEQIQAALQTAQPKKARAAMRGALKEGAAPIRDAMATEAPRASGFLAQHFNVKVSTRQGGTAGTAYVGPQGKINYPARGLNGKGRTISVESVARFLEFGTRKMAANPFITRAFEGAREISLAKIIASFKKTLGL